jgi:hypothetical protein
MPDSLLFIGVARQQGYSVAAAQATLAVVAARLREEGVIARRFYIYRTGDAAVSGESGPSEPTGRQRVLLAFQSADAALAFAQAAGLGPSPRLIALSLSRLLAVLVQRPTIIALLVAAEGDAAAEPGHLPPGTRVERTALLELLAGVAP